MRVRCAIWREALQNMPLVGKNTPFGETAIQSLYGSAVGDEAQRPAAMSDGLSAGAAMGESRRLRNDVYGLRALRLAEGDRAQPTARLTTQQCKGSKVHEDADTLRRLLTLHVTLAGFVHAIAFVL
jgi:hypothetical protein